MTDDQFWDHIRAARSDDPEEHAENLADRLAALPVADILAFGRRWVELQGRAFTREVWGAAYLINGGCDADDLPEFLDWLILQGEAVYSSAVTNPDSLADVVDGESECEVEASPAYEAYSMVSEQDDYTDALLKHFPDLAAVAHERRAPAPAWPFKPSEFRARLPRLSSLYIGDQ
jgi:Protein of unknown function (DUF4240)